MTNKWISRRECLLLFKKIRRKRKEEGRKSRSGRRRERMNLLFIYVNGLAHKKKIFLEVGKV